MSELSAEVRPISHDVAVPVAALLAGRIDGQQAVATLTAQTERLIAEAEQRGSERVAARVEADVVHEARKHAVLRRTTRGTAVHSVTIAQLPDIIRAALKDGTP